jgi:hypothetical protein
MQHMLGVRHRRYQIFQNGFFACSPLVSCA